MKYLIFLVLLLSGTAYGQSTYYIRADSIRFQKVPSTANSTTFILENATRYKTGGYLRNRTDGRTDFYYAIDSASVSGGNLTLWRGGGTQNIVVGFPTTGQRFGVSGEDATMSQTRTVEQAGFTLNINNTATGQYFKLQPSAGRMEFYAESGAGATYRSVGFDATPDDIFMTSLDTLGNTYLVGAGVGGTPIGTGVLLQVSNIAIRSLINIKADSIVFHPGRGVMNIDSLRTWVATDIADTTYKKPMTWDTRNGRWEYGNWHGGAAGATPTLQQVLDAGSTLTSSETIVGGANNLSFTGTANQPVISVTNTNADGQAIQATAGLNGYAITTTSPGAAGLQINRDGAFNNNAPTLLELRRTYSGGNGGNGIGGTIDFYAETSGGVSRLSTQLISTFPVATDGSRISHFDITGDSLTNGTIFANFQPAGIVRVNNLNDTLATKAYARSVGGGGGTPGGSDGQFQYNNGGAFGGATGLVYDDGTGNVLAGTGSGTSELSVRAYDGSANRIQIKHDGTNGTILSHNGAGERGLILWGSPVIIQVGSGFSGVQAIEANTGGVVINEGGADRDFRIESDALTEALNIDGGTGEPRMAFLAGSGSRAVVADAEGDISAPVSDRSVKENIRNLNVGINDIMKLKPVSFEYKQGYKNYGSGTQMGFIAQDIQRVFPNSVYTNNSNGKMGYNATDLIPVLVRAVQDQQKQINELKELVKILIHRK